MKRALPVLCFVLGAILGLLFARRYQVTAAVVPAGVLVVRHDTLTGRTWVAECEDLAGLQFSYWREIETAGTSPAVLSAPGRLDLQPVR